MTQEQATLPCRCGACGYDLQGLAVAGQCPECGEVYAAGKVVLFGWGRGLFTSHLSRGHRGLIWTSLLLVLVFLRPGEWSYAIAQVTRMHPAALMYVASLPMMVGAAILQRWMNHIAEPLRLTLAEEGALFELANRSDTLASGLWMGGLACWLVGMANLHSPSPYGSLFTLPMLIPLPIGWFINKRQQAKKSPVPWQELEFAVGSDRRGRARLTLKRRHPTNLFRTLADLDLDLTAAQVDELRHRLAGMCQAEEA